MANDKVKIRSVTKCEAFFFFVGGILILGGIALAVSRFAQKSMEWGIEDKLIVRPNSEMLDAWINPKIPVYMKFYVFNVTNADAILQGKRPVLTEHGPYTYRMMSPRFDIQFFPNRTVAFRNNNTLHFVPDMSAGSEEDVLYHINIPLLTVQDKLKEHPRPAFLKKWKLYDNLLQWVGDEDLIIPHTVKKIIFGYKEPMLNILNGDMTLLGTEGVESTFGPFHGFNNSDDGLFLVNTGEGNFSDFNQIQRWNGETRLPYWSTEYANMLNGTYGSFLKPKVRRDEPRYLYFPQMRRSLKLEFEEDTVVENIKTYRYHFARDLLTNASAVPDNVGFCVPQINCFESGLLNVGTYDGETAPMFISLPHFYNGDSNLYKDIVGLKPNKTLHDSFFHVEPMTGAVVLGQRRLQINTHLRKGDEFSQLKNVRSVFFPYFWLSGEARVSNDMAKNLRTAVLVVTFSNYIGYIVIAIGLIFLVATLSRRYRRRKTEVLSLDEQPLLNDDASGTGVDA